MPRKPSPAQRAAQVTFVLKGHLKNAQIAYLRAAAMLAKVRDEKLYAALKHKTMDDYAAVRLGLQHAALYRYLQIYDWAREFHPGWLARKPKGFIPELTDAYALMWIEHHLTDPRLSSDLRAQLEKLRAKALAGKLTVSEFEAVRTQAKGTTSPLRSLLSTLRSARRRASLVPTLPANVRGDLERLIGEVQRLLGAARHLTSVRGGRHARVAARASAATVHRRR